MTEQQTSLTVETIDAFKATLRGALLCPGDNGYDDARRYQLIGPLRSGKLV